jgi:hypothetical protein
MFRMFHVAQGRTKTAVSDACGCIEEAGDGIKAWDKIPASALAYRFGRR